MGLKLEPLVDYHADLRPPVEVGTGPFGMRRIFKNYKVSEFWYTGYTSSALGSTWRSLLDDVDSETDCVNYSPLADWVEVGDTETIDDGGTPADASDDVLVTKAIINDEEVLYKPPVKVMRGVLHVGREARQSFLREFGPPIGNDLQYAFFNKDHPNYSAALDATVRAWLEHCAQEEPMGRTGKSEKQQIKEWLTTHYLHRPGFSENLIKQIASIVNPNKGGGAPKTTE